MPALPILPPEAHDQLLRALLSPQADFETIAATCGLTILQLTAWFNLSETQAAIAAIREMARARAQLLADLSLPAAVETLQRINDNLSRLEAHPEAPLALHLRLADTARRTATAIQRMATPRAASGAATRRTVAQGDVGVPADSPSPTRIVDEPTPAPARARDRPELSAAA